MLQTYYIYEITNNLDGKTYIGQRYCPLNKTPETDVKYMGNGTHLKLAEKKYGLENFSKRILAICYDVKTLDILEVQYISLYKSIGKAEYNIAGGGQTKCREYMTEEQISELNKKIGERIRNSEKHKDAMKSLETRKKMSDAKKGKPSPFKGIKFSEERCEEMSQRMRDMYNSPKGEEVRSKIREKRKEQIITEETRKRMSDSQKGRFVSEETREKLSKANTGKKHSEETKQKIRNARAKQAPMSEESKTKQKKSIEEYWNSEQGQLQRKINSERNKSLAQTKGYHWYNNGIIQTVAKECPEGFIPGQLFTRPCSEESKQKKRDWYANLSEEEKAAHNKKAADARRGKSKSDTCKANISKANKGRRYYNNGEIEVMRFECPEGFVPGRCPKAKAAISKGNKTRTF